MMDRAPRTRSRPRAPAGRASLKHRLDQAERTIQALLADKVDAVLDQASTSAVMLRQAQQELRSLNERLEHSEAYFRSLIENVSDLITVLEADGTTRYISPSVRRLLGYEPAERIGHKAFDLVHPDDAPAVKALMADAVARGLSAAMVSYRYRHKDGSWRHFESSGLNLLGNEAVRGVVVTSRDVTQRLEIEGRYRSLFDNMIEGFAHCRMLYEDGAPAGFAYLEVNGQFEPLTGLHDVVGKRVTDMVPGFLTDNADFLAICDRVAGGAAQERVELYMPALERWFAVALYAAEPLHFIAVFDNITERKRIEERLRQSEAAYRGLIERAPLGIFHSTADARFLTVNPALVAMLGYDSPDEVMQLDLAKDVYLHPEERLRLAEMAQQEAYAVGETQWKRKDGTPISVTLRLRAMSTASGELTGFDCFVVDVTAQRLLEQQFQQAQRLEAVGRLAGGVAHDFNNLLTAIIGYTDLLLDNLHPRDRRREDAAEVRAAAERATDLTRQLLAFSRKQVLQTRLVDLNHVVDGVQKMLQRLIGEDVHLVTVPSAGPAIVRADPGQIEQVLLNLAVNARDAMPEGGTLTIETVCVVIDGPHVTRHPQMATGPYVMVAVTDTGVGMDADVLPHLFEPFFTTKAQGKGTGLGLATVYGIVKQSGGWIWVDSEPGRGSTFKVYLPQVEGAAEASAPVRATAEIAGGRETILVAEDDAIVRLLMSRVLEQKGYQVLLASDGTRALELSRAHDGAIDLLVTDVVMPGMGGRALALALMAERPRMRLLYMSGYTDDAVFRNHVLDPIVGYLQKPFTGEALALKVRQTLDTPTVPQSRGEEGP